MILRAKTKGLLQTKELTEKQKANTELNQKEMDENKLVLKMKNIQHCCCKYGKRRILAENYFKKVNILILPLSASCLFLT